MLPVGRVLAIGAHPDDVELQAGGTIAAWTRSGVHVEMACFSAGEKGADQDIDAAVLARRRQGEAHAAARLLGASDLHFLGGVDGELEAGLQLREAVARLIRVVRPDVVVGHDPWRRWLLHPDHRAAGILTVDGTLAARDGLYYPHLLAEGLPPHRPHTVLLYSTDAPDHFVDVTETMPHKIAALGAHVSQVGDNEQLTRRLWRWNAAIGWDVGMYAAEAYRMLDVRGR